MSIFEFGAILLLMSQLDSAAPLTFMISDHYGQRLMIPVYAQALRERSDDYSQNYAGSSGEVPDEGKNGFQPSTGHFGEPLGYPPSFKPFNSDKGFEENENFDDQNDFNGEDNIHRDFHDDGNHIQSIPVSKHVEVTKPFAVPIIQNVGVPVVQPVNIHIPHPVAVGVPQPYPVAMPVSHPVPIQIFKTVAIPVEKKVPFTVEKHIPIAVEKPVPIHIERHIPVPVERPYPIKVPVYKTIHHHPKSSHH